MLGSCIFTTGRKLTGIILPEEKLVQIDALEVYEAIKNKDGKKEDKE